MTIAEALRQAGRALQLAADAFERESLHGPARPYSQREGERPTGCGRAKYLRVWRLAHRACDDGARSQGKSRLLTVDAFERFEAQLRKPRRAVLRVAPQPSTDDRILTALGGRRSA
jgi:hypothetical protein